MNWLLQRPDLRKRNNEFFVGKNSFTLIEVVLTLSIVSIAVVVIMQSFLAVLDLKNSISNYTKALILIDEKMFELQAADISAAEQEGKFAPPYNNFFWQVKTGTGPFPALKNTILIVYWKERGNNKQIRIITFMAKKII